RQEEQPILAVHRADAGRVERGRIVVPGAAGKGDAVSSHAEQLALVREQPSALVVGVDGDDAVDRERARAEPVVLFERLAPGPMRRDEPGEGERAVVVDEDRVFTRRMRGLDAGADEL